MRVQWLFAGLGPAIVAACGALLGVPIYFWVADRRRRGEPVRLRGLPDLVVSRYLERRVFVIGQVRGQMARKRGRFKELHLARVYASCV